jgi:hypothetical protein
MPGASDQRSAVAGRPVFADVADALRGLLPAELGTLGLYEHRYGIKVWFDSPKAPREHYEAQVVGSSLVPGAKVLGLEVGFHSEYPEVADNEEAISRLLSEERSWRSQLGRDPVAGPFLGRAKHWRRISETWADPDLGDPELPFELAARLSEYVTCLEPHRRKRTSL